jgi:RsiW-degrading membrane proteinase PrsW (M82 family)
MGLVEDLKSDVVGLIRDPTEEQKAILAAIVVIAVADRYLQWNGIPFVVRTTAAVGIGFAALFLVSYALTGQFVPPDEDDDIDPADETG